MIAKNVVFIFWYKFNLSMKMIAVRLLLFLFVGEKLLRQLGCSDVRKTIEWNSNFYTVSEYMYMTQIIYDAIVNCSAVLEKFP